jgi:hypothetical protein
VNEASDRVIGPYTGQLAQSCVAPELLAALADLPRRLNEPANRVLHEMRNRTVCVPLPGPNGQDITVVVKSFARPSRIRSWVHRRRGSKARRSWQIARQLEARHVGTPRPLGFLERWVGAQLLESHYLTEFQTTAVDGRAELIRLFSGRPDYEAGRRLLELIAREVRALHAAGIQHNDLGHQNILVHPTPGGWENAQFIDLNRARIRTLLSVRQRALEIARLWLPHSLRSAFFSTYLEGTEGAPGFQGWFRIYRLIFLARAVSRDLRHPGHARQRHERNLKRPHYPDAANL